MRQSDPGLEKYWRSHLSEAPYLLDERARHLTLRAILDVCEHRKWVPYAVHVRTTHVHAVVGAKDKPERILSDCKAYSTRALRLGENVQRRRYWTSHGSTRHLWNEASLRAAVDYVLNGQGGKMALYPNYRR